MKNKRQTVILKVISSEEIDTQYGLLEALLRHGVKSTQATLSRDIKELNLTKELGENGKYRYVAQARDNTKGHNEKLRKIFKESVLSSETAQNIVVIKTLPGLAMAASSAVDSMQVSTVVGSVAGDDTVFLAMKDSKSAEAFCAEVKELL
ncbi:MAG: arginine repressor [Ruminococcaceae bacterium]|nr:arginine repressor [Oscillospiraceae bacterium]